jgi:hypothetical protein
MYDSDQTDLPQVPDLIQINLVHTLIFKAHYYSPFYAYIL